MTSGRSAGIVLWVPLVPVVAAVSGWLVVAKPPLALALASLVMLVSVPRAKRSPFAFARPFQWVPYGWATLFAVSNIKFTTNRSPLAAAAGGVSKEIVIELFAYAAVAGLTLLTLQGWDRGRARVGVTPLLLWPSFALLSTIWSVIPLFTFVRALQLFVPILLCALTARIWIWDHAYAEGLWKTSLRLILQLITVAVVAGFVFRHWPVGRFTWPLSPTPITSSGIVGMGFVLLFAGGPTLFRFSRTSYTLRLVMFGAALLFGQTRSVLLAVAVASLVTLWLSGRDRPGSRYFTMPFYLGGLVIVFLSARSTILTYIQRGRYGGLASFNGRLPLWHVALNIIAHAGSWLIGLGYGATRVVLSAQVTYGGEAHNSWVEFLLELGVVGVALAAVNVVALGSRLLKTRSSYPLSFRAAAGVFSYILVVSVADHYLNTPGFIYTSIAFFYALTASGRDHESSSARVEAPQSRRLVVQTSR